jgi:O-antigen/teichoic acid export membrane protein
LFLHLIIGMVFLIIIEPTGYFLFKYTLNIPINKISAAWVVFHATIIITFLYIITVPYEAVINSHENILALSIFDVFNTFLRLIIVIYIATYAGNKLKMYAVLTMISQVLLTLIKQYYSTQKYKEVNFNILKNLDKSFTKEILYFTLWNFFGSVAGISTNHIKGLILNMFYGVRLNTPNGIASNVGSQISVFSNSMTLAINPQLVKSEGGGDRIRMLRLTSVSTKFSIFIFVLFALPIFLELPLLLKLWLKNVPEYTVLFCRLILIYMLLEKLTFEITTAIRAVGQIKKFQLIETIIQIGNIPISYFFLKAGFSPAFIYYTTIAISTVITFERLYFGKILVGLDVKEFLLRFVFPPLLVLFIAFLISFPIQIFFVESIFRLFLSLASCVIITLVLFRYIVLTKNEFSLMAGLVKNSISKITFKK